MKCHLPAASGEPQRIYVGLGRFLKRFSMSYKAVYYKDLRLLKS